MADSVIQLHFNRIWASFCMKIIFNLHIHIQFRISIMLIQAGMDKKVGNVHGRGRIEIDITENPAEPPEILILQPACITPAVDLNRQLVLAFLQVCCNIVFGRGERIFTITG
ncbi:hypothetical protein D3C73_1043930 [compost metagenome]